jgi:hypothetical protein
MVLLTTISSSQKGINLRAVRHCVNEKMSIPMGMGMQTMPREPGREPRPRRRPRLPNGMERNA